MLPIETEIVAEYRFGGDTSKRIFSLWHNIDRRLRPAYWSPECCSDSMVTFRGRIHCHCIIGPELAFTH